VLAGHKKFSLNTDIDWREEFGNVKTSYNDKAIRKNISSHFIKSNLIK
jgi:hypothetical protein